MEQSTFTGRDGFIWGVNGHNQSYPAYPVQHLEQQIRLAAELGVKMCRLNYTPETAESFLLS